MAHEEIHGKNIVFCKILWSIFITRVGYVVTETMNYGGPIIVSRAYEAYANAVVMVSRGSMKILIVIPR